MVTQISQKNLLCANAIHSAVDILLNETTTDEQQNEVASSLGIIFKNIMPFLRGEEKAEPIHEALDYILKLHSNLSTTPSTAFVKKASAYLKMDETLFFITAMPSFCKAVLKELVALEDKQTSLLYHRFVYIANIICPGETIGSVSKQLSFINSVLNIPTIEFIGDEACKELTDIMMTVGDNFAFSRIFVEDFVYSIFGKIRLANLTDYYIKKDTKKSREALQELNLKYGNESPDSFIDNPFVAAKAERNTFVKGLQKYTLETLVLTKQFLEENNLRFYLTEGTLLGAVRHNGFIPWDDDIDIAMPRKDYDRLVELAKEGLIPPELNFDSLETNPKHWVLGAKMQLVRKTPYIQHKVTKLSRCNGPYVDIFPLDYWSRPAGFKYLKANICVKAARRLLFMKTGYSPATKGKPFRILGRMIIPFITNRSIEKFAIKNMKKFYKGNRKYSVNLCSYYPYYKEVFPTSFFGEPKYISFEGEQMPVPCEYEYMLKTVYGKNYDTIPPVKVTTLRKHAFEINPEVEE